MYAGYACRAGKPKIMSGVSYFCTSSFNADVYLISWPVFPTARCGCLQLKSVPEFCSSPAWCLCFASEVWCPRLQAAGQFSLGENQKIHSALEGCFCAGILCGTVNGWIYSFSGCGCSFFAMLETGSYCIFLLHTGIAFNTVVFYIAYLLKQA